MQTSKVKLTQYTQPTRRLIKAIKIQLRKRQLRSKLHTKTNKKTAQHPKPTFPKTNTEKKSSERKRKTLRDRESATEEKNQKKKKTTKNEKSVGGVAQALQPKGLSVGLFWSLPTLFPPLSLSLSYQNRNKKYTLMLFFCFVSKAPSDMKTYSNLVQFNFGPFGSQDNCVLARVYKKPRTLAPLN